jgi:hypothetical protein
MKIVVLVLGILSLSSARAEEFVPNIQKGNARVFGSTFFRASTKDGNNEFDIVVGGDYFFWDHLGFGPRLHVNSPEGRDTTALLGAQAYWEFWQQERLGSYVLPFFNKGLNDTTVLSELGGDIGVHYFLTQSVALGPYLEFRHEFSHVSDWNDAVVGATFEIYL